MAAARKELIWTSKSRRDLIDIWKYFAETASSEIADKVLRGIGLAAGRLADHPFLGRPRADIADGLRSILAPPHLIIYRVGESHVEIARVLHERRDIPAAFSEHRKP